MPPSGIVAGGATYYLTRPYAGFSGESFVENRLNLRHGFSLLICEAILKASPIYFAAYDRLCAFAGKISSHVAR